MKKSLVILISLGLIVLLSMSVVSASWFGDFWKKITGRTTENETNQTSCTDECSTNGNKQCSGAGYQTCGNYDSDSCLELSSVTSCSSSETCVGGNCVSNTYTCTDSDGGKDYNTKGNVVASSPTSSTDVTDLCSDSTRVVEYFCNPDKTQSGETYTCPNGCSNGACISSSTNQTTNTTTTTPTGTWCTDSDGGKNYNIKGNTLSGPVGSSTATGNTNDYCSGKSLVEYFCGSNIVSGITYNTIHGEAYTCPNGCSNGACISSTNSTNQTGCTNGCAFAGQNVVCWLPGSLPGNQTCGNYDSDSCLEWSPCISSTSGTTTTTTTTTTASGGGGGGGGGGSTSTIFEEKKITEEKFEGEIKITTETKELTNEAGNKVEIEIKTEIKEDGTTIIEEKREFINKDGKLIKLRFRFENDGENIKIKREVEVEGKKIESELEILEKFEGEEVQLKAKLSDGSEQEIKIMPDRASEIAIEKLKSKNLNVELKEVGEENNLKAVYIAKVDETGKLLGLFKVNLKSEMQIDSETGEILNLEKAWWNFLIIKLNEPKEFAGNQTNVTNITLPPPIPINLTNFTINNTNNIPNITLPPPINQTNITNITLPAPTNITTNYTCTDSDGGKIYNVKGTVVSSSPTSSINVTDLCSSSSVLIEYFCTFDKQQSGESHLCPNGCSNGACI